MVEVQVLSLGTTYIVLLNQGCRPKWGAAGWSSLSCDVSLLSPFSYIDNTVGRFNYSPSVGESKPLQRHTLIPPPFFFSAGHSLSPKYHFPELYAHYWIKRWKFCWRGVEGMKTLESYVEWSWGGGSKEKRGGAGRVGIWVFELSPRTRLSLVTAFLVASAARPTEETHVAVPQFAQQTQITALCAQTIIIIIKLLRVLTSALLQLQF